MEGLQGRFLSLGPEDIERYRQFREALEYLLGRRKQLTSWMKRALGRVSVIYKIRALLVLQLLSGYPALFIDIKGLCYVAGILYRSKDQRNVEIWLKRTVEGKWRNGWEKLIERVKVHATRYGTYQSSLRPLRAPPEGMIYPRLDVTIEWGSRLPRSEWAYRFKTPLEYDGALFLMDLTCEGQRFSKQLFKLISEEDMTRLASEIFQILDRLIKLKAKCGLTREQPGLDKMYSEFEEALQKGKANGMLPPDPNEAVTSFVKRYTCEPFSIGEEWVLKCCKCGGDNPLGKELPKRVSCGFCGTEYTSKPENHQGDSLESQRNP